MHECKICLNTYSDREKLHQHLTESGHFRTSHQLKESGAPPVEFLISMSKRKPKEIELPRICRVCSLSFINQKSLSSHLKKSGHFSSGKRKRNTCNATASDEKGNDDELSILDQKEEIMTEYDKNSSSDEVQNLHCEVIQSDPKKVSSEFQMDTVNIPLETQMQIDLLDPRECSSTKIIRSSLAKPCGNVPLIHQCLRAEGIPWKLIPISLSTSPVPFHNLSSPEELNSAVIDPLGEQLKEKADASFIPSVKRKMDSVPINTPTCDTPCGDNPPTSIFSKAKENSQELDEKNNINRLAESATELVSSFSTSESSTDNNLTSSCNSNVITQELPSFHAIANSQPMVPDVVDLLVSGPPYPSDKSYICRDLIHTISTAVPFSASAKSSPRKFDDSFKGSETITQPSKPILPVCEVVVDGGVDQCSRCSTSIDIARVTFCLRSGSVTYRCNLCNLRTVMRNALTKS